MTLPIVNNYRSRSTDFECMHLKNSQLNRIKFRSGEHMKKPSIIVNDFHCFFLIPVMFFMIGATEKKTLSRSETDIMVFAAVSLAEVVSEIADSFESSFNVMVKKNLASSGTLARQITQGGVPDLFISADKRWIEYVDSLGYMQKGYIAPVAKNQLVIIASTEGRLNELKLEKSLDLLALLGSGRLSIGDPAHVPAGKYAREALEYFGWYEMLIKQIIKAKDVRSALMIVEMGESLLGLVYRTDALKSKRVKILATFPQYAHEPIVYIAGLCKNSQAGKEFINYLKSNESRAIWAHYKFQMP